MQSGDDSLWESFPHILESLEGVRRYISAFQAPLQELSALSPAQIHTLRACSLLAIPPPPERVPLQGGFPTDISELNLLGWAALVQDVAAGLQALSPNLGHDMGLPAVALLQLLEASTGVGYCRYCCRPGSQCTCMGASQPVPPVSWSQVVEQTPGYGVTASSGGMTTPSTSVAGMPGYVVPPPGITPPDFSSWSLPPPEASLPQGLPVASQGLSHIGRSIQVRAVAERQARAQPVQCPRGLAQPAQRSPRWHCTPLRWCCLSISHHLGGLQLSTSRQYSHLTRSLGGESRLTPPQIKLPSRAVPVHRTVGDLQLEGREMVADPSVAPGGCRRRRVCSHCVRRAICPPGQCQVFHHQ